MEIEQQRQAVLEVQRLQLIQEAGNEYQAGLMNGEIFKRVLMMVIEPHELERANAVFPELNLMEGLI